MAEDLTGDEAQPQHVGPWGRHTRREMLRYGAAATAMVAVPGVLDACGGGHHHTTSALSANAYKPVALTQEQMTTLQAVLAQLFPKDNLGPGAVEAGVHVYIDRALAGSYKSDLPVYQQFLPMFDKAAKSLGAKSFSDLSASKRVDLLKQFEAGKPPGVPTSDQKVVAGNFQLLLEHMREGMFADPMYGGNRGMIGWDLMGFPGVKLMWTAHDQALGTKLPQAQSTARTYGGVPYNGPPS